MFTSCESKESSTESVPYNFSEQPDQMSENYFSTATELGKKKYTLWTARVEMFTNKKRVHCLDSMIVSFVDKKQNGMTRIYAHAGTWDQRTNDLSATKNVSVVTADKKYLFTDTLYYENTNNKLYSKTDVMFVQANDTTWGSSFESDTHLENITIFNQRGIITPSE